MADHSNSLPVTAKSTDADGCNSRRISMGKPSSSGKGEKVLPHYLRASTGSCHDFCKYGKKHDSEEKARRPFPRRITKKPPDNQLIEFQLEKNKTPSVELKPSSYSKTHMPITPEIIKCEVPIESVDRKTSVSFEVLARKKTSTGSVLNKSFDRQSPVLREILAKKKTLAGLSLTKSFDSQRSVLREVLGKRKTSKLAVLTDSVDSQNSVTSESCVEKEASVQGRRTPSVGHLRTSPDSKTHLSTKILKQDISSSGRPKFPSKQAASKAKQVNLSAKPKGASSLKPKLSFPDASRVLSGRQKSDVKMGEKTGTTKITLKKVQSSPRASLSLKTSREVSRGVASRGDSLSGIPSLIKVASLNAKKHGALKVVSPLKGQMKFKRADTEQSKSTNADSDQPARYLKDPSDDVVQEKTLYVIKMKTDGKYLESGHNGNLSVESWPPLLSSPESPSLPKSPSLSSHNGEEEEESEYTVTEEEDELLSECDETEQMEEVEILEAEHKRKHRNPGMATSEDKDSQPVKLDFRRGRVVDIQSENNGPRRLKFRPGRTLGENQNIKVYGRKNFKRRGVDDNVNDGKPDSEKVVLRHQDMHGKKDAKGLFNNVIEETASKLVETRKSKVKALVGAFETVISLQDSKPSANTLS